ncbi:hypothetical protein OOK41_03600 [Micromonospora sp. NBC_01655]|uniref:hypothetical protein n=1 Tax=Micromonospora sp. NBC_01655 TaxID=2975983 RepID=UPI00225325E4|nr:hypothetical protein [Micromonospora sp. NBC_01655]MCX4469401.1 hypothetical protein [Micromonospora sp. NBC_01655]
MQAMDPQLLSAAIGVWLAGRATAATSTAGRAIAVDGKTLRGSRTTDTAARHVMTACDQSTGVVLGSVDVDGCGVWPRWRRRSRRSIGRRARWSTWSRRTGS